MSAERTDSNGRPATGIPPIECPSWCTDPGHVAEQNREDQNCYSADRYVMCSLEDVEVTPRGAAESMVGATAYRGFNCNPVVQLHVYGFKPHIDKSIELTAVEATQLAEALFAASEMIDGDQAPRTFTGGPYEVDCPICGAPAGGQCRNGERLVAKAHPYRMKVAGEARRQAAGIGGAK